MAVGETVLTVHGGVCSDVMRKEFGDGKAYVGFMAISNERRFDKDRGEWVDGNRFKVWVRCWKRLGHNVEMTLNKGDDVIVHGRLHTYEYERDGEHRTAISMDAIAVGPNLARSIAQVRRVRAAEGVEPEGFLSAA